MNCLKLWIVLASDSICIKLIAPLAIKSLNNLTTQNTGQMKKKLLLFTALFAFILNVSARQSIIKDVFEKHVEDKISTMQEAIDISDEQAVELKKLELKYLIDVNSAENCFWCRTKKRVEKLKVKKEEQLKEILTPNQYIKYDALANDKIKKHPVYMN